MLGGFLGVFWWFRGFWALGLVDFFGGFWGWSGLDPMGEGEG